MPNARPSNGREGELMNRLDEIAEYAETHDFSAEMETGTWEADTEADRKSVV